MVQILQRPKSTGDRFAEAFAGIGQGIPGALGEIEQRQAEMQKKQAYSDFADAIEKNNPKSLMHKFIADVYRSGIPDDQKNQVVKALSGTDPFKQAQQERLALDSILNRYTKRIKEVEDSLKNASYKPGTGEKEKLLKQKKDLQAERDELLGFRSIQELEVPEMETSKTPEETAEEDEEIPAGDYFKKREKRKGKKKGKKEKFDPEKNKTHMAKYNQLFKEFDGDVEKIEEVLAREFE